MSAVLLALAFVLSCLLALCAPGWSQATPTEATPVARAPIVLDGYELFNVEAAGNFTAEERAKIINGLLQEKLDAAIAKNTAPQVNVLQQNNQVSLQINNRHLLTVMNFDMMPGMRSLEQADIWAEAIEDALERARYERTPRYTRWAIKLAGIAVLANFALQGLWFWLKRRVRRKNLQRDNSLHSSWLLLVLTLLPIVTWIALVCYITNLFPLTRRWLYKVYTLVNNVFSAEIFSVGERALSLNNLLLIVVMAIALLLFTNWLTESFKSRIVPLLGINRHSQDAIAAFTRYAILFIGLLLILTVSGVDFRSLAILISVLGVGIGFGLQNIAKDFISGLIMIFERPIQVGELVQVGDTQGLVQRIGPRVTEMTTIDRVLIMVPNSRFIEGEVHNWNRTGLTRLKVYVDVAYGSDMQLVQTILLAVAQMPHPEILKHPRPKAQFRGFGESGLNFRIVVFLRDPLKQPKVKSHLLDNMALELEKYNIEIPFAQHDLNIKLPGLEEVTDTWLQQQGLEDWKPPAPVIPELPKIKPEYNWEELIRRMRGPQGLQIRDRRYGLKMFANCFTGTEAVDWFMEYEQATRPEAIIIGELMTELGMIHHVLDEHGFEDGPLFYRFYADEPDSDAPKDDYANKVLPERDPADEEGMEKNPESESAAIDD